MANLNEVHLDWKMEKQDVMKKIALGDKYSDDASNLENRLWNIIKVF